ncbi:IS66 family transposase [Sporosarcina sp. FSL K6-3457]|uniref:IS66 family transposase n=1 Tax=Sporosarcina sp. FSL K6-3457 TaxID=2978204 RepID=UPI0030F91AAA
MKTLMKYTPKQIDEISHGKPSEIAAFITGLLLYIEKLENHIVTLETRVKVLERQVGLTSTNSSKPPSSDGLRKPKSLRETGGKKGAPKGNDGHTLEMIDQPDEIKWHKVKVCPHCETSLTDVRSEGYARRQVFDLPFPRTVVTEHRVEKKCCPHCSAHQQASFPENVIAPAQYRDGWTAWCTYLNVFHYLPLERISQLFQDLTGYRPSEATLLNRLASVSKKIEPLNIYIQEQLVKSPVLHADETGLRIEGKTQWLHVVSNSEWTLYHVHKNRGKIAIDERGCLPIYRGTLVHDCWASYFHADYSFTHALCGAHLLRECQGIIDYDHHQWATDMKNLLQEACYHKKKWGHDGKPIENAIVLDWEQRYDRILEQGEKEWITNSKPDAPTKRGRKKKSKAANLGERLRIHKSTVLRFIRDEHVPFDNNLAERDIRMMKVKQKVSGTFRKQEGAEEFARIRGFISTLRKQNRDIFSSLTSVVHGQFSFE